MFGVGIPCMAVPRYLPPHKMSDWMASFSLVTQSVHFFPISIQGYIFGSRTQGRPLLPQQSDEILGTEEEPDWDSWNPVLHIVSIWASERDHITSLGRIRSAYGWSIAVRACSPVLIVGIYTPSLTGLLCPVPRPPAPGLRMFNWLVPFFPVGHRNGFLIG